MSSRKMMSIARWNDSALERSRVLGVLALLVVCSCEATPKGANEPASSGVSEATSPVAQPSQPTPQPQQAAPPQAAVQPVAAPEVAPEPVSPQTTAPKSAATTASPAPPEARPAAASEASEGDSLLLKNIASGLRATPFSAVVQHLSSKAKPLDDGESKVVYQVRVIESIRGPKLKTLEYSAVVEKGDEKGFPKKPVILALCKNQDGYYWPGVGAQFPSTKETRAFVTKIRPELSAEQKDFEFCD